MEIKIGEIITTREERKYRIKKILDEWVSDKDGKVYTNIVEVEWVKDGLPFRKLLDAVLSDKEEYIKENFNKFEKFKREIRAKVNENLINSVYNISNEDLKVDERKFHANIFGFLAKNAELFIKDIPKSTFLEKYKMWKGDCIDYNFYKVRECESSDRTYSYEAFTKFPVHDEVFISNNEETKRLLFSILALPNKTLRGEKTKVTINKNIVKISSQEYFWYLIDMGFYLGNTHSYDEIKQRFLPQYREYFDIGYNFGIDKEVCK